MSYFPVVLLRSGPHAGKTAVIAEIIDHNRVRANHLGDMALLNLSPPGHRRRTRDRCPSPFFPLPTLDPHTIPPAQISPCCRVRNGPQTTDKRRDRREVEQVDVGDQEGRHREAKVTKRLREIQDFRR